MSLNDQSRFELIISVFFVLDFVVNAKFKTTASPGISFFQKPCKSRASEYL